MLSAAQIGKTELIRYFRRLVFMRKTTLLAAAALLSRPGLTLAQNTPEENNPNADAPFVRNIRADRPGQTITAQVLKPGQFQLEVGELRQTLSGEKPRYLTSPTLRIGFFNSVELRVSQPYLGASPVPTPGERTVIPAGWAPLTAGIKFMVSPNYDTRTQVAVLVESSIPGTGAAGRRDSVFAPSARLLVSEQLGQRFGLEANFGFGQRGLTVAALEAGQFIGSLALNGPLGNHAGFFAEVYGTGRSALSTGTTAGLYWRPTPLLRFDVNTGRDLSGLNSGSQTVGAGVAFRLGK